MPAQREPEGWVGPPPLHNPLGVARLGAIYSNTAAFYDGLVAEKQAGPKLAAIEMLNRQPAERFLEVGAGTGWAFGRIAASSGTRRAYAIDVAEGMLQVARDALVDGHNIAAPSLLMGDGRSLPFPDASLDCILNSYTFEVLSEPDIPLMILEMLRALRPGGRAVIVNLTDATDGGSEDEAMIDDWKRRYVDDPEYFGGARPLQLAPMLEAHGFERVRRRYVGPEWPSEVLLAYRPSALNRGTLRGFPGEDMEWPAMKMREARRLPWPPSVSLTRKQTRSATSSPPCPTGRDRWWG